MSDRFFICISSALVLFYIGLRIYSIKWGRDAQLRKLFEDEQNDVFAEPAKSFATWIPIEGQTYFWKCSNCGAIDAHREHNNIRYCWNCGFPMKNREEESDDGNYDNSGQQILHKN